MLHSTLTSWYMLGHVYTSRWCIVFWVKWDYHIFIDFAVGYYSSSFDFVLLHGTFDFAVIYHRLTSLWFIKFWFAMLHRFLTALCSVVFWNAPSYLDWPQDASSFDFVMLHRVSDAPCFDFMFWFQFTMLQHVAVYPALTLYFDFSILYRVSDSQCFAFISWFHCASSYHWFAMLWLYVLTSLCFVVYLIHHALTSYFEETK